MAAKDKCPSCHQRVSPGDFLCPNCELILDPALAPARPSGEVSVVRRLLEIPHRGLPPERPSAPPRPARPKDARAGAEGPTRIASLPPERPGVPIVVASLDRVSRELTEFDAWVVSLIDGASDIAALAKKAGLRELELRVVLETLHERMVVDFADEPLPDEPLFGDEVARAEVDGDEPLALDDEPPPGAVVMGTPTLEIPGGSQQLLTAPTLEVPVTPAPPPAPRGPPPSAFGEALAAVTGAHAAFVPGQAAAAPLPVEEPPRRPSGQRDAVPPAAAPRAQPARTPSKGVEASPPAPARYPGQGLPPSFAPTPAQGRAATPRAPERTDPRIAYTGQANRKVLDALKKVKRRDEAAPAAPPRAEPAGTEADARAASSLQVALRMEQHGRFDEAVRYLERSIAASPDAPTLYNRLAIIVMRERADLRRAEQLLQKAVDLAPDNEVYAKNLKQVVQQRALRSKR